MFGERLARDQNGDYIDAKQKNPPNYSYVLLSLFLTHEPPNVNVVTLNQARNTLLDNKFRVFLGSIMEVSRGTSTLQVIGSSLGPDICNSWVSPPSKAPCIVYFREDFKASAFQIQAIVKFAQSVPDDHIFFLDFKSLDSQRQELLTLSHMDAVIVLN
jgi:hypothetical protein